MRIQLTKYGMILLCGIAVAIAIVLIAAVISLISKAIEDKRIRQIPDIKNSFVSADIIYKDLQSLRQAFRAKYKEIGLSIDKLKELKQKYPENKDIIKKLASYENYRTTMEEHRFKCPEHNNKGSAPRVKRCNTCDGDGKIYILKKCGECDGTGLIHYNIPVVKNCPVCGHSDPSDIPAKNL